MRLKQGGAPPAIYYLLRKAPAGNLKDSRFLTNIDSKSEEPQSFSGNLKTADTRDVAPSKTSSGTEMWCKSEPDFC